MLSDVFRKIQMEDKVKKPQKYGFIAKKIRMWKYGNAYKRY